MLMAQMRAVCLILYECYLLKIAALSNIKSTCLKTLISEPRLLNLILLNLIVRWPVSAAIILKICGMRPSVFERLGLWMVEWFHLNGKQANIRKTGNLSQLCDLILRVSVDNYTSVNILKMLWRSYCEKISMTEFIIKLQYCYFPYFW